MVDQNIEPNERCGEVSHVTGSSDHGCGQVCSSMYNVNVVLYLGYLHILLESRYEDWIEKSSEKIWST